MTHGSLFSGIGGFDLAAQWMGWENVFHCEWNEFRQKVLHHYWPKAIQYNDITKTDFTIHRGKIDILTGGFPCQPYSSAGKRKGKEDERHLWPQMLRAIREIQPRWVVGENVLGLVNWSGGLVFHEVQADLEAAGYEVWPYVLPAVSVNAPHRRDRVWFVAYATSNGYKNRHKEAGGKKRSSEQRGLQQFERMGGERLTPHPNGNGLNQRNGNDEEQPSEGGKYALGNADTGNEYGDVADTLGERTRKLKSESIRRQNRRFNNNGETWDVADTSHKGLQGSKVNGSTGGIGKESNKLTTRCVRSNWQNFPTISPLRKRDDGVSNKLLRFVVNEFYDTNSYTSKKNRIKNLQEVWDFIQQKEIWEQIRGFYSLESKIVLLQTMQLYSGEYKKQEFTSPFGEKLCEPIMQYLRKHKEFRCSPQGQELEKQRAEQFGNSLSFLPHEIALAARRFETAISKFEAWHRNESIKAAGNAIVPQVVLQIFKAIEQYETPPPLEATL